MEQYEKAVKQIFAETITQVNRVKLGDVNYHLQCKIETIKLLLENSEKEELEAKNNLDTSASEYW